MKKWFVYILECEGGSLYTGITIDVEKRFLQHKMKRGGKYTASHKPTRIVHTETYRNRSEASKRENQIKVWRRNEKISILKLKMPG